MKDMIYRQDAIDALGEEPLVWDENDDYDVATRNQWRYDVECIKEVPSAEPEPSQVARDICTILENEQDMRVILKNAQLDLSGYSDKLWKLAYERGKAEVQAEIVRCKDCKYWHREMRNGIEYFNFSLCELKHYGDGHNFYCADAKRRKDDKGKSD